MRAVVQRVTSADVSVGGTEIARIGPGLLVLVGVEHEDGAADASYLADKLRALRICPDAAGKMNRAVTEAAGEVLLVSQFTLLGDCRKGRRPSFGRAAPPEVARPLFEALVAELRRTSVEVRTGEFGAEMQVRLTNDGPVTLLLDSRRGF